MIMASVMKELRCCIHWVGRNPAKVNKRILPSASKTELNYTIEKLNWNNKKQSPRGVLWKSSSQKFHKIHRKTPSLFFHKVAGRGAILSWVTWSDLTHFITPWKHLKTFGFLLFSGGIERDQWHEMG